MGKDQPWVSGTLIYEESSYEKGKTDWFEPVLKVQTPLTPLLPQFFLLFISTQLLKEN